MKYRVFQFQRKNTLRPIYICIWAKYNRIIQFEAINKLLCCFCTKLSVMIHLIYNLNCRITSLKIKDNKHPSHKYFLDSGIKVLQIWQNGQYNLKTAAFADFWWPALSTFLLHVLQMWRSEQITKLITILYIIFSSLSFCFGHLHDSPFPWGGPICVL